MEDENCGSRSSFSRVSLLYPPSFSSSLSLTLHSTATQTHDFFRTQLRSVSLRIALPSSCHPPDSIQVSSSMAVSPYPTWSIDSIQRLISQIKPLEMSLVLTDGSVLRTGGRWVNFENWQSDAWEVKIRRKNSSNIRVHLLGFQFFKF